MTTSSIRRIGVVLKAHQPDALKTMCELATWLAARGLTLVGGPEIERDAIAQQTGCAVAEVESEKMAANVDLVLVLGGDGTMIATSRLVGDTEVPVLGINFGGLGYLAEFRRFVFSGAANSPADWSKGSAWQKILSNFTIAPIIEFSSGRPFNIITNVDTNNDQSTQTDRPNVNSSGVLVLPAAFTTGSLGRNLGITHNFMSVDLGITRAIRIGEKARIDLIAQGFNLFNRFNEGAASPLFTDVNAFGQRASNGRYFSRSTAAYDPRQFQFGAKLSF